MKSSNILMMAMLMAGMGSNLFTSSQSDIKESNDEFKKLSSAMESISDEYEECFNEKTKTENLADVLKICKEPSHNKLINDPIINNYLKKLQDAAINNNASKFTAMFNQVLSQLKSSSHIDQNLNPYTNLQIDQNKAMQDIAKIQPLNWDTFFNYINGLLTPKKA